MFSLFFIKMSEISDHINHFLDFFISNHKQIFHVYIRIDHFVQIPFPIDLEARPLELWPSRYIPPINHVLLNKFGNFFFFRMHKPALNNVQILEEKALAIDETFDKLVHHVILKIENLEEKLYNIVLVCLLP